MTDFHLNNGFHFTRLEDGRIRIYVQPEIDKPAIAECVTDDSGFASAMATLSRRGETYDTWLEAQEYLQKQEQ